MQSNNEYNMSKYMKIAYISNVRIPTEKAHGIQIMKMCQAFAQNRAELDLIIPKRINKIKKDPFNFYSIEKDFNIKRIFSLDLLWIPFGKALFFWIHTILFTKIVFIYCILKKYDIYYTRDFLVVLFFMLRKKNIYYEVHSIPNKLLFLHKLAWKKSRGVIVISNGLKIAIENYGIDKEKILLARDAVDVIQFQIKQTQKKCREKLNIPQDQKIALYAGHLYNWKGVDLLAQASKNLEAINVYLVGGAKEDIIKFKKIYTNKNLHIIGWQPYETIAAWLQVADILVLPSSGKTKIGSVYTSPLKLFEYLAAKKPLVISSVPALQEVLGKDPNVYTFCADDKNSLIKNLKEAMKEKKIPITSQKIEQFSWQTRAKNILTWIG